MEQIVSMGQHLIILGIVLMFLIMYSAVSAHLVSTDMAHPVHHGRRSYARAYSSLRIIGAASLILTAAFLIVMVSAVEITLVGGVW